MTAPPRAATQLSVEHRAAQEVIGRRVAGSVLQVWQHADLTDVDRTWPVLSRSIAGEVEKGHAESARLAADYMRQHAQAHGTAVDIAAAEAINVEQLATAIRVTGPVAVKTAARAGMSSVEAGRAAAVQLVGASTRLTLLGGRQTVVDTIEQADNIRGWRRVGVGRDCEFCSMLISRGAVYKSERSAKVTDSGRRYHDHCNCAVEALYVGEADPLDIGEHFRAYVTGEPVSRIITRDLAAESDEALAELLTTATRDDEIERVLAELDMRDEVARAAQVAEAERARKVALAEAQATGNEAFLDDEFNRRVDAGDDPEQAYADIYGASVETMRREQAIAALRGNGYKGRNFDELSRDAFRAHVAEVMVDAEAATRGHLFNGTTRLDETRDVRKLFTGNEAFARAHASDELLGYWQKHGRMTLEDMRASLLGGHVKKGTAAWI